MNAGLGFLFILVGVALFAFYAQPGSEGLPALAREDQILPHFLSTQVAGVGLVVLMLAGQLAALVCLLYVMFLTEIPKWWYGAFTILPTLLVGAAASYLFPPPSDAAHRASFWSRGSQASMDP